MAEGEGGVLDADGVGDYGRDELAVVLVDGGDAAGGDGGDVDCGEVEEGDGIGGGGGGAGGGDGEDGLAVCG